MTAIGIVTGLLMGVFIGWLIMVQTIRKKYIEDLNKWNEFLCVIKKGSLAKIEEYLNSNEIEKEFLFPVLEEYRMIIGELHRIYRPEEIEDGDSGSGNE